MKEKQTWRRRGGGGYTAHAFQNRQKLILIHSGLAATGRGQPPCIVCLCVGLCLATGSCVSFVVGRVLVCV